MKALFNTKNLFISILFPVFVLACSAPDDQFKFASETQETNSADEEPIAAPDFTIEDMEVKDFTLSDHQGKIVVLNIWATWCPPCREEIPYFIELQDELRDDVLFVGVSVDEEGWEVVEPFAQEFGINYPLVVDDGTIVDKYGPYRGIPTTFFINCVGEVEYVAPGMIPEQMLRPMLLELIAG